MTLIEKLKIIRDGIKERGIFYFSNAEYEYDAELRSHNIGNQDIYRLRYIDFYRINVNAQPFQIGNGGVFDEPYPPFMLPEGMTREEGFKVLSYLTDYIEKNENLVPAGQTSVSRLNDVLDIERFGFKRVEETDENKILDLFTVDGRTLLFKRSRLYKKYFEWYSEGITKEEVEEIYSKIGIQFTDPKESDKRKSLT